MSGLVALTIRELKKWYKDPFVLGMSIIQPVIWMGLFGKAFNLSGLVGSAGSGMFENLFGTSDYFSFMAVGIIPMVILFTTMFGGMSIVWDRRLGFLNKVLSTPVARSSIVFSKVFTSVLRSLAQVIIVILAALALGLVLRPDFDVASLLLVFGAALLLAIGLASMFIAIAVRSRRWETQMAIANLLNLPLLFASNALFPVRLMPDWLQTVANVNPVSYA
ncbi:MAG: ABC transporter permease, partial [Thermoplasmata archaeon]|nr:ABC transporter permease [Thermoplasmata archaeon]